MLPVRHPIRRNEADLPPPPASVDVVDALGSKRARKPSKKRIQADEDYLSEESESEQEALPSKKPIASRASLRRAVVDVRTLCKLHRDIVCSAC